MSADALDAEATSTPVENIPTLPTSPSRSTPPSSSVETQTAKDATAAAAPSETVVAPAGVQVTSSGAEVSADSTAVEEKKTKKAAEQDVANREPVS